MTDHFFVSCVDAGRTALILGPFTNEDQCRAYAYSEPEEKGDAQKNRELLNAVYQVDPRSYFFSFGMVRVREVETIPVAYRGVLNKTDPGTWDPVLVGGVRG